MRRLLRVAAFATTGVVIAALALPAPSGAQAESGEAWAVAQDASLIKIVHGQGASVETITLPAGTGPHLVNFSPSGTFAYVSGVGNGNMVVVRVADRQTVATINFGASNTHEAKPSPEGTTVFVAQILTKTLFKVAADEETESWTVVGSLDLGALLGKAPVCTAFRADGQRAYVSLTTSDIAIVDVPSLALLGTLTTDGAVACGFRGSKDGKTIFVSSNGTGGHLYRLDTTTDSLTNLGYTVGATDLHDFGLSPSEKRAYATDRGGEALRLIDLTCQGGACLTPGTLSLDPTPGANNDRPNGVAVGGNIVYVGLMASGKLAVVKTNQLSVTYLDLVAPSTNALPHVAVLP